MLGKTTNEKGIGHYRRSAEPQVASSPALESQHSDLVWLDEARLSCPRLEGVKGQLTVSCKKDSVLEVLNVDAAVWMEGELAWIQKAPISSHTRATAAES